jgi:hypothetical protein
MLSRSKCCLFIPAHICSCASFIADLFRKKVRIHPIGNRNISGDKLYETWMQPICISSGLFYSVGTWGSIPGVKRLVCEANLSHLYSVEVKNGWSYTTCVCGLYRNKAIHAETVLTVQQFHRSHCFIGSYFNVVSIKDASTCQQQSAATLSCHKTVLLLVSEITEF